MSLEALAETSGCPSASGYPQGHLFYKWMRRGCTVKRQFVKFSKPALEEAESDGQRASVAGYVLAAAGGNWYEGQGSGGVQAVDLLDRHGGSG